MATPPQMRRDHLVSLRDVAKGWCKPWRLGVAASWLVITGIWALLLLKHLFSRWPHHVKGFGDLMQRLHETGVLVAGHDPYVIGRHISDNVPPSVSLLHLPLYAVSHPTAEYLSVWLSTASMAVLIASLWITVTSIRRSTALLVASAVAPPILGVLFYPTVSALVAGQDQLWFMALVVVDLFVVSARRGGVLVGAVAGLSVWPVIFFVAVAARSRWRGVARGIVGGAGTVVLGAFLSVSATWHYWTYLVPSGQVSSRGVNSAASWPVAGYAVIQNVTLNGTLSRAPLGGSVATKGFFYLVFVIVVGLGVVVAWRLWRRGFAVTAFSVLSIVAVEASPFAWDHHWVWVLLPLPFAAIESWRRGHRVTGVLFGLGLVPMVRQLARRAGTLGPAHHGVLVLSNPYNFVFLNRYQITGLVLLAAAALSAWRPPQRGSASPELSPPVRPDHTSVER